MGWADDSVCPYVGCGVLARHKKKKAGTLRSRLAVGGRPDKLRRLRGVTLSAAEGGAARRNPEQSEGSQAVLRGLSVRSLICARMLDICRPFSCETKGSSSAIN
jgi:hypothetical protein